VIAHGVPASLNAYITSNSAYMALLADYQSGKGRLGVMPANLSPFATYLKVGTTALVLQALANGAPAARITRLNDPLGALTAISRYGCETQ